MNVDKFGHHVHKRLRLSEVIRSFDEALTRSENGVYDLKSTKLTGLTFPTAPTDAVNKEYIDNWSNNFYTKDEVRMLLTNIKSEVRLMIKQCEEKFDAEANLDRVAAAK